MEYFEEEIKTLKFAKEELMKKIYGMNIEPYREFKETKRYIDTITDTILRLQISTESKIFKESIEASL